MSKEEMPKDWLESKFWYDVAEDQVHTKIWELFKFFHSTQSERLQEMLDFERMYGGRKMSGLMPWNYYQNDMPVFSDGGVQKRNLARSVVDAIAAEIAQNKARPTFLTKRGNNEASEKAKLRTKYVDGQFYRLKVYDKITECTFDDLRVGNGVFKVGNDGARPTGERVHPGTLFVVDPECIDGTTTQIHEVRFVSKATIRAEYAYKEKGKIDEDIDSIIMRADPVSTGQGGGRVEDMVVMIESWKLPAMKGNEIVKEGRHSLCVSSGEIFVKPWKRKRLPFAIKRFAKRPRGFWGIGVVEIVRPSHIELNKMIRTKQEAFALCSAPWLVTDEQPGQKKINVSHFRNESGCVIRGGANRIQLFTPPPVSEQLLQEIEREWNMGFELAGVSRMAATQISQLGPDASGAAQRELADSYSRRFALQHAANDQFTIDIAEILLDEVAEMANQPGVDLSVEVPDGDHIEIIDWADAKDGEDMIIRCLPTNFFAASGPSRKQDIYDAIKLGWITREQGMKQMDSPDMSSEAGLITAFVDKVDRLASIILSTKTKSEDDVTEKVKGFWPEPFDDLATCSDRMNRHYVRAQATDADEWRLDLMRQYIERAELYAKQKKDRDAAERQPPITPPQQAAPQMQAPVQQLQPQ